MGLVRPAKFVLRKQDPNNSNLEWRLKIKRTIFGKIKIKISKCDDVFWTRVFYTSTRDPKKVFDILNEGSKQFPSTGLNVGDIKTLIEDLLDTPTEK